MLIVICHCHVSEEEQEQEWFSPQIDVVMEEPKAKDESVNVSGECTTHEIPFVFVFLAEFESF